MTNTGKNNSDYDFLSVAPSAPLRHVPEISTHYDGCEYEHAGCARAKISELESRILRAGVRHFQIEAQLQKAEEQLRQAQEREQALRAALEGMAWQFGDRSTKNGVPVLTTAGYSDLETAFDLLGWQDPQPMPEGACDEPGCAEWATCGTPTKQGYKHLCYTHYRAALEAQEQP